MTGTAATSVPQSFNSPPHEGIRGLRSLASAKGFHLRRTWARVSRTRPHGRNLGSPVEPRGPGLGIFPGAIGAQAPALARGVPTPSLDPRRTPASLDKRPSASMALGHQGPGWGQLAYVAANPQTPPSRPHHYEDPPVLPSVKGSPFTDGRTGGRPPGDGFPPSRGCLVWGPEAGPRMRRQAPSPQGCLRATGPTLEISCQVHRVPGVVSGETEVLPATQRTPRFLLDPTCQRSPTPAEAECPGKTWGPRVGEGGRPLFSSRWSGRCGRNPHPPRGSPGGTQA